MAEPSSGMQPRHADPGCPLCASVGGELLLQTPLLRIILVEDDNYPGYCRVVATEHVREMTDLAPAQIAQVMGAVFAVEDALRAVLAPDKINLASLGNQTPHLHWHVIPRYADDAHFPQPIWGARQREPAAAALATRRALLPQLAAEIRSRMPAARAAG